MARQSVDKLASSREPNGRQVIWDVMVKLNGWFTIAEVFKPTFISRRTIASYLKCLIAGGFAKRETLGINKVRYHLIGDHPAKAPRLRSDGSKIEEGSGTENMWRTIRKSKRFNARDVAVMSTTSKIKVSEETAVNYCSLLYRTGYLRVLQAAVPGKSQAIYRLIRNSGPLPPMVQAVKHIFDPNTNEVHIPERQS